MSPITADFCSRGGEMRSRVVKNTVMNMMAAATPYAAMVSCQPSLSSPWPNHFTMSSVK